MTDEVMDWDSAYREQRTPSTGPPPWNIGEPHAVGWEPVTDEVMDWDSAYREQRTPSTGPPPWNKAKLIQAR